MKETEERTMEYREIREAVESEEFRKKQQSAIDYVIEQIRKIDEELSTKLSREMTDVITYRIKSPDSIIKKLKRKGYEVSWNSASSRLNDLAGVRVICSFQDDVYRMAGKLQKNKSFSLVKTKDYIKKPKSSGYQSIHIIVDVPIDTDRITGQEEINPEEVITQTQEKVRVEIQLRTVAMNFWAKLDHQLCYKKDTRGADKIGKALKAYSEEITRIDKKMLRLRKKIEEI